MKGGYRRSVDDVAVFRSSQQVVMFLRNVTVMRRSKLVLIFSTPFYMQFLSPNNDAKD